MKTKTNLKVGAITSNHNQTAPKVRSSVHAGLIGINNHNQTRSVWRAVKPWGSH